MVRVKICGIRRQEDADAAMRAGAGALGFNFVRGTPRYISPLEASRIVATLPEDFWSVGVFANEDPARVREIASAAGVSVLQFHGGESPEYWDQFIPFKRIKAFKVGDDFTPDALRQYASADAYLLDGAAPGMHGGTGRTFDWSNAVKAKEYGRIIVAGGLSPDNVANAVRTVRPWAVDVSSGVESAPGQKDAGLIRAFIGAVRAAEAELAVR